MKTMSLFFASCLFLTGCGPQLASPNLVAPGVIASTPVDTHGVVCYTTVHRGEFSCVKVK